MWRRRTRWMTTRWVWPDELRRQRYGQLHGSTKFKDVFDQKFLDGLERRRDLLEGQYNKIMAFHVPIFLMLTFALLKLDMKLSIAGFSVEGARSLREILIVLSGFAALMSANIQRQLSDVKQVMRAAIEKLAGSRRDALDFLSLRYGIGELSNAKLYDDKLVGGRFHIFSAVLIAIPLLLLLVGVLVVGLTVQVATLREIWLHPNFSRTVAVLVIAFTLAVDVIVIMTSWQKSGLQPFNTFEDVNKLAKLHERDETQFKAIIADIVREHGSKNRLMRLLTAPRLKRFDP